MCLYILFIGKPYLEFNILVPVSAINFSVGARTKNPVLSINASLTLMGFTLYMLWRVKKLLTTSTEQKQLLHYYNGLETKGYIRKHTVM